MIQRISSSRVGLGQQAYRSGMHSQRPAAALQTPPAVQFKGLDGKYFEMMFKISLGFWAGLAAAVGGGIGASHFNHQPERQAAKSIQQAYSQSRADIEKSADALATVPPEKAAEALQAHQQLVKGKIIEQAKRIQAEVATQSTQQGVSDLLKKTDLSPEELAATEALMQGKGFEAFGNPADAFDHWVDTVLSKRTSDKAALAECKQAARELYSQAKTERNVAVGLMAVCVAGSLVSTGIFGAAALGGTSGIGLVLLMAPAFGFGALRELLRKKKPTPAPKMPTEQKLAEAKAEDTTPQKTE